jgi:hypothetical protein
MIYALHHLTVLAMALAAVPALGRGQWTHRCPRSAIVAWQAAVFSAVAAAVGLALTVALLPYERGILSGLVLFLRDLTGPSSVPEGLGIAQHVALVAGLLLAILFGTALACSAWSTARARGRHRRLLDLVAHRDARAPDALVLDHPLAAAYCLPGRPASVVLTAGTLDLLTDAELRAVLAHERAHAAERHHLVVLPFNAFRRFLPRLTAPDTIRLLIEMCADDRAARQCGPHHLADALDRFATAHTLGTPPGALGATDPPVRGDVPGPVEARVARLRGGGRELPVVIRLALITVALTVAATPVSLFALPWSR